MMTMTPRKSFLVPMVLLLLQSCATPTTQFPRIDNNAVDAQRLLTHRDIIQSRFALLARLHTIAWPILRDNQKLCGKTSKSYTGMAVGNDKSVKNMLASLTLSQVRAAGFDERYEILAVADNSPAHDAGLQVGDTIETINNDKVTAKNYTKLWNGASEGDNSQLTLGILNTQGVAKNVELELIESCAYPINLSGRAAVTAYTNGKTISVTAGMLRQVDNDDLIAFVVGHELGHATSHHVRKGVRNFFVSGAFVITPVVGIVGSTVDILIDIVGLNPARSPGSAASQAVTAALVKTRDFEREADYIGVYFYARSGGDLNNIEDIFKKFSQLSPGSTWGYLSHPVTPERMLSIAKTREEIHRKQMNGDSLVPNGYEVPKRGDGA